MTTLREAAQQALEALTIGCDAAYEVAQTYHASMAGYRPAKHLAVDEDVRKIESAITALKAALDNYDAELAEIDSDGARCGVYNLPAWCEIHQHHKWCEHNGGKMGPTGWEKP